MSRPKKILLQEQKPDRCQPLGLQGVLHHVFDDPVGSEQLGGGLNDLRFYHLSDHLILLFGDI